jgi:hypothetical protein
VSGEFYNKDGFRPDPSLQVIRDSRRKPILPEAKGHLRKEEDYTFASSQKSLSASRLRKYH